MKCQNCGKNECSFHYTSSINGKTTEVHLCSECADKLGYSNNVFFNTSDLFEDMVSDFFGGRSALGGFGMLPRLSGLLPRSRYLNAPEPVYEAPQPEHRETEAQPRSQVDPDIAKRRELNVLREQMRRAAEAEDYEKAAELRDEIRKIEGQSA